jgi:hypothetical protein
VRQHREGFALAVFRDESLDVFLRGLIAPEKELRGLGESPLEMRAADLPSAWMSAGWRAGLTVRLSASVVLLARPNAATAFPEHEHDTTCH